MTPKPRGPILPVSQGEGGQDVGAISGLVFAAALVTAVQARADTLVVCTEGSPDFLNAALSTANTSFDVTEQTSDRLIGMEVGSSGLVPALAESWSVSEDGLTYTFKLRRGVKWQSNAAFKPSREFNADDVLFTFNRMADKAAPFHGLDSAYPEFLDLVGDHQDVWGVHASEGDHR